MRTIDTTCTTLPTALLRPCPKRVIGPTPNRRPPSAPRRRSMQPSTAGQLAREEYVRAVVEARTLGVWL